MSFAHCYNGRTRMKNSDSFTPKSFFEQWLPRLIALAIFAYVIYSLVFKGDKFSGLHVGALAIILVLILAPMASRLKVFNVIEFSSKLNDLKREQQETRSQLNELRNQISTVVSTSVNPIQIFTMDGSIVRELFSSLKKTEKEEKKDREYTKEEFLRRSYGYRSKAYVLLLMTMDFQIATREHRAFELADQVEGNTMDEIIPKMVKRILDNGLDSVFPIMLTDEKNGEERSVITPEIVEGLEEINSLIDLSQKIENDEIELPSRLDIDSLFNKVGNALATIGLGLEVVGINSILFQYKMTSAINALRKEIEQSEIEQRPISFPPQNSD
jgi:hypothetical protein